MSLPTHPSYRPDIDGLRAIAVAAVVAFHAAPRLVPGGFVGVDIFFVISGYLISRIIFNSLEQGTFRFTDFYARRIRRIFPALSIVLLSCLLFGWFYLLGDEYERLGKDTAGGVAFMSNILLWQESGYFDAASTLKPLLHLWSLGVEEQFYIIWPVLAAIAFKYSLNLFRIAVLFAGVSFALNVAQTSSSPVAAFYLPHTRFWEFQLGCMLAYAAQPKHRPLLAIPPRFLAMLSVRPTYTRTLVNNAKATGGLLLIVAAIIGLDKEMAFPGWLALLPTLGTAVLISAGPHAWINRKLLANHTFVFVGLISYPLYLWHWPLLSFARIVGDGKLSAGIKAACVVLAIWLAWLTYKFVERPIRKRRTGKYRVPYAVAPLTACMLLLGLWGMVIAKWDGIPSRFPDIVEGLVNYKYSYGPKYRMETCFLGPHQAASSFRRECTDANSGSTGSPLVFLWGDSHAAHLYPGIHHLQAEYDFKISPYTASGCPPIVGMNLPKRLNCTEINEFVFAEISHSKPDSVILAANWPLYYAKGAQSHMDLQMLRMTIGKIAGIGVKTIVLVGSVPQWEHGLPKALFNSFRLNKLTQLPARMKYQLNNSGDAIDVELAGLASEMGVAYLSPKNTLCNPEGCLTTTDGTSEKLTAFDYGHLTEAGSIFVMEHNLRLIFSQTPAHAGSPRP